MTASNGASSAGMARPFVFPMFSNIQHPTPAVINAENSPISVEASLWAL